MSRISLACVGHVSIDHRFQIEQFPVEPTKTPASTYAMGTGGMAANAAVAAARMGASVSFFGRVGSDSAGRTARDALIRDGIDTRGLEIVGDATTSVSTIVVDNTGERQIFNCRGNAIYRAHELDTQALHGFDAILTDPRWVAGAESALIWARENRCLSMIDADVAPEQDLRRLVPLADWVVFSQGGMAIYAPDLSPQEGLRRALQQGCHYAVVTFGERGAMWLSRETINDEPQHEPAFPVKAVDTTAAGDVFHGVLILALAEGLPIKQAMRIAGAAAAYKCANGIGASAAPSRDQLVKWLAERG
jgi:sulfofructose kinase